MRYGAPYFAPLQVSTRPCARQTRGAEGDISGLLERAIRDPRQRPGRSLPPGRRAHRRRRPRRLDGADHAGRGTCSGRAGIDEAATILEPRKARVEEVPRVHSEEHVAADAGGVRGRRGDAGGGYTPMDEHSYDLALLSAGSALTALDAVVSGGHPAHALLRRSGHHAWRDSGYGFCVFNNCAIVARTARGRARPRAGRGRGHRRASRQRH